MFEFYKSILSLIKTNLHKLLQLSSNGGRLIISSDGVWDALSFETACNCSRGLSVEAAANQIVKVLYPKCFPSSQ